MMTDLICYTVFSAFCGGFFLLLLDKWRIIERLQLHAPNKLLAELSSCWFCMSWWMSLIWTVILWCIFGGIPSWTVPLVAIAATPITRKLI